MKLLLGCPGCFKGWSTLTFRAPASTWTTAASINKQNSFISQKMIAFMWPLPPSSVGSKSHDKFTQQVSIFLLVFSLFPVLAQ